MKKNNDINLMVKIAQLYYKDGMTQAGIAEELGMTRLRVIEFLKRAKSEGIVRIEIINPEEDFLSLEDSIAQKYGLKKVLIVSSNSDDSAHVLGNLGKAAASYLNEVVSYNDVLGIGWGMSVYETAKQLKNYDKKSIITVPLIGGGNETHIQYDVNDLTKKFAAALGGESFSLFAPALVDSKVIHDAIVSDSKINQIYDFWNNLDIAIIGIGMMTKEFPTAFQTNYSTQPINFQERGIVGDILSRFYDIDGNSIFLEMHERMIGIDFATLKKAGTVIGVAGGLAKYNAILGAIRGRVIDILITDEKVANKLALDSPLRGSFP
jgi:DNA-binding transcriptional regulator LsrR (DeoR family)